MLRSLDGQTFEEACFREEEWVPIWMLGVNGDVQDKIPQPLWTCLARTLSWPSVREGTGQLFARKPSALPPGCAICTPRSAHAPSDGVCEICTVSREQAEHCASRDRIKSTRPDPFLGRGWRGQPIQGQQRSQLDLSTTPSQGQKPQVGTGRLEFDYSSIQTQEVEEELLLAGAVPLFVQP